MIQFSYSISLIETTFYVFFTLIFFPVYNLKFFHYLTLSLHFSENVIQQYYSFFLVVLFRIILTLRGKWKETDFVFHVALAKARVVFF